MITRLHQSQTPRRRLRLTWPRIFHTQPHTNAPRCTRPHSGKWSEAPRHNQCPGHGHRLKGTFRVARDPHAIASRPLTRRPLPGDPALAGKAGIANHSPWQMGALCSARQVDDASRYKRAGRYYQVTNRRLPWEVMRSAGRRGHGPTPANRQPRPAPPAAIAPIRTPTPVRARPRAAGGGAAGAAATPGLIRLPLGRLDRGHQLAARGPDPSW